MHRSLTRQNFEPYRRTLLTIRQVGELSVLRPEIPVRHTLLHWGAIIFAWSLVAIWPTPLITVLAIPLIGCQYYGLLIIGHDGLHRRLFSKVKTNDLWNDLFILAPIAAITRLHRGNHMNHHKSASTLDDPDRHKYMHTGKETTFRYLIFLTGTANLKQALANIHKTSDSRGSKSRHQKITVYEILLIVVWQSTILFGLTLAIGWWAYPLLWLLPVYIFAYTADVIRVFAEHSMMIRDDDADDSMRLITYTSSPLERVFFAPHNMNFHAAHHLWPSIPYYHLPEADRLIRESAACDQGLLWRSSYLRYLMQYGLKWSRKQPSNPSASNDS